LSRFHQLPPPLRFSLLRTPPPARAGHVTYEHVIEGEHVMQVAWGLLHKQDLSRYVI